MFRVVFMGTPDFAVPSMKKLIEKGHEIAAVVTQPDKPSGRKHSIIKPSPVKETAIEHGIKEILQPDNVMTDEFFERLKEINPDLIVTVAYGKILPQRVLDIPRLGCINIHASLLPKYRGAAPIQWAIINGDKVTGITAMLMDAGMDTGDILMKREVPITENMTYGELHDILKELGAEVLSETLDRLENGSLERTAQDHSKAVTVPPMEKEMCMIDWNKPASGIHNLVRGTNPWPGAYTYLNCCRIKIWQTRPVDEKESSEISEACRQKGVCEMPGTIVKICDDCLIVATGKGFLKVTEIQPESKKKMGVCECGHNMNVGEVFGH